MKLYKLSLLALALAGTMVACSDDDYTAPAATPGAFFPVESPDVVILPMEGNSVDITVRRNSDIPSDQTFNLTSSDPSGLFKIPSSVTFTGHEVTSQIHVTFDPEAIVTDQDYPAEIKIDGLANSWGITDYKFSFNRETPTEITELGEGVYVYSILLTGGGTYEIEKQIRATKPDEVTYVVKNWFDYPEEDDGVDLTLTVRNDIILPNGYPLVEMGFTELTFRHPSYDGPLKFIGYLDYCEWRYDLSLEEIRDDYAFTLISTQGGTILDPSMISYYDPERGTFYLYNVACVFPGGEFEGYFGPDWDYLYLPGFPDYDLNLSYLGFFTNENDEISAYANLYAGEDIESVEIYNVATDDPDDALEQVNDGLVEGEKVDFTAGGYANVSVAAPGAGDYTMIAIAYAEDEIVNYAYVTYTISGSSAAGNWQSVGTGSMIDGWVLPAYSIQSVVINPFDYPIKSVEIEKNLDVEGEYRMLSPYTSEYFPLLDNNKNTKKRNIVFNIADPDWPWIDFQPSGYAFEGLGMEYICDANWFMNNILGMSKDEALATANADLASYYENGVLEVVYPAFAAITNEQGKIMSMSSDPADILGCWSEYPSAIYMPDGSAASVAAKAIRKMVSNDQFLLNVRAKASVKNIKMQKESRRSQKPQLSKSIKFVGADAVSLR